MINECHLSGRKKKIPNVHPYACVTLHKVINYTHALDCHKFVKLSRRDVPKFILFYLALLQVFNFTVGVKVEQHSQPLGKAEQDMTKLCNHRRKVVAMAALCRSMQVSQLPFPNLHYPGTL